jgi:tRNA pseudouridine32 synthase / 23S rRNA pseudouridine746 synthase
VRKFKFLGVPNTSLVELVQDKTKTSSALAAKLIEYGAVKLKLRSKGSFQRIRDPKYKLHSTDLIEACIDEKVLSLKPFINPLCLFECAHYGVWFKPANIMSQGTDAGDQTSLLYGIEKVGKTPFLVHRLDRETQGPMIVAYHSKAAHQLSEIFLQNKIKKYYHALVKVHGFIEESGVIEFPLDQKEAKTSYRVLDRSEGRALLEVELHTGRLHQIRRHLDLISAPVMGDPKYGQGNKNKNGLALAAVSIEFIDPWTREKRLIEHKEYNFYLKA